MYITNNTPNTSCPASQVAAECPTCPVVSQTECPSCPACSANQTECPTCPILLPTEPVACPASQTGYLTYPVVNQTNCPIVCEQQLYAYLNLLGIIFGAICLASYFVRRKFFLHVRAHRKKVISMVLLISFWVFLTLFVLYFLKIEYQPAENGCPINGILLKGTLLPDNIQPLYEVR